MDYKEQHNHSSNSFLMGVIVGGVATLLITTKKGREIVKEISSKSLNKFSEIQKNLEEVAEFEDRTGSDFTDSEMRDIESSKLLAENSKKDESLTNVESIHKTEGKSHSRRLFKRSKNN